MTLNNKRLRREQSTESAPDEGGVKLMSMTVGNVGNQWSG